LGQRELKISRLASLCLKRLESAASFQAIANEREQQRGEAMIETPKKKKKIIDSTTTDRTKIGDSAVGIGDGGVDDDVGIDSAVVVNVVRNTQFDDSVDDDDDFGAAQLASDRGNFFRLQENDVLLRLRRRITMIFTTTSI
jgi:hypothetical protein